MNKYLEELRKEFDLETHLGNHFYPDYDIDWSRIDLKVNGVEYSRPLDDHERLFTERDLELLEVLTADIEDTKHRISVKFDQDYRPIIRVKKNLKQLVEV